MTDQTMNTEVETTGDTICPRCGAADQGTHHPLCQHRDGTPTVLSDETVRRALGPNDTMRVCFYEACAEYRSEVSIAGDETILGSDGHVEIYIEHASTVDRGFVRQVLQDVIKNLDESFAEFDRLKGEQRDPTAGRARVADFINGLSPDEFMLAESLVANRAHARHEQIRERARRSGPFEDWMHENGVPFQRGPRAF